MQDADNADEAALAWANATAALERAADDAADAAADGVSAFGEGYAWVNLQMKLPTWVTGGEEEEEARRPKRLAALGYRGWPEAAPFDAILVTAAPPQVPAPRLDQLAAGGRLVIPVGAAEQMLPVFTRTEQSIVRTALFGVRFVPMTGKSEREGRD